MSWLVEVGWLAAAAGIALLPLGNPVADRLGVLAARGRLGRPVSHRSGERRTGTGLGAPVVAAGAAIGFGGAAIRAGPAVGAAAALAIWTVGGAVLAAVRRRRSARAEERLLAAIRVLVAELAAGAPPPVALAAAGEIDPSRAEQFSAAAAAARSGVEVGDVLAGDPQLRVIGHAWTIATTTGASLADVLGRVGDDLAARREQAHAVSSALAGPRSSALLLAALPALGIALGAAMAAHPLTFLFGDPAGRLVLLTGVALDAAGLAWTRRLADHAERS